MSMYLGHSWVSAARTNSHRRPVVPRLETREVKDLTQLSLLEQRSESPLLALGDNTHRHLPRWGWGALPIEYTSTHQQWLQKACFVFRVLFVYGASLKETLDLHFHALCLAFLCRTTGQTKHHTGKGGGGIKLIILSPKSWPHFDKNCSLPSPLLWPDETLAPFLNWDRGLDLGLRRKI